MVTGLYNTVQYQYIRVCFAFTDTDTVLSDTYIYKTLQEFLVRYTVLYRTVDFRNFYLFSINFHAKNLKSLENKPFFHRELRTIRQSFYWFRYFIVLSRVSTSKKVKERQFVAKIHRFYRTLFKSCKSCIQRFTRLIFRWWNTDTDTGLIKSGTVSVSYKDVLCKLQVQQQVQKFLKIQLKKQLANQVLAT